MLSLMLGMGIVSRLVSGWIADHIGGLRTLLLGSVLQGVALFMFLWADGVSSLYLVSAMFGLFQGGIVPSYALIVREYFTPKQAGARVGTVLMATLFGVALFTFLWADGVSSLFLVSAMFGLFQGGIVPRYALIVREYFTPKEAGARVGTVLMATLFGMALGGWMSGEIFDLSGSYRAAFVNGIAWNALNIGIVLFLLGRAKRLGLFVRPLRLA